jgi:glycosyltransferase involved in cell wall biosynthesis
MKKILLIINNIVLAAGTERATVNLANNLSSQGYLVEITSINSVCGESFYPLNSDVKINHLNFKVSQSLSIKAFLWFRFLRKLYKHTKQGGYILIGTIHSINIFLSILKFFNKQNKYVGCEHIGYAAATNFTKFVRRIFYKKLDAVIVLTQDDLSKYTLHDKLDNCFVIPNQISFLPDIPSTCEEHRLLAIGRLTNQKGFDLMLDAVSDVLKKHTSWKLNIVGEGEMEGFLRDKIVTLGLDKSVNIVPFTKDILMWFSQSSIYLMTSRFEGLPMVLLEAKACGLPIISYDCPTGPSELLNPDDGYLVAMGDKDAFSRKLDELMSDERQRKFMGKNALANVQKYTSENIYKKWNLLFNRL